MLRALYKKKKTTRFDVLLTIVVIIFAILLGRVFYLQAIEGDYYRGKAEGNRLRMLSMTATRGLMYDRNVHDLPIWCPCCLLESRRIQKS